VIRLIPLALGFSLAVAAGRLNGQTSFGTTRTALVTVEVTTSGSQLTALAVAIPEPAEWALLVAIAGGAIATCRSKRRVDEKLSGALAAGGFCKHGRF